MDELATMWSPLAKAAAVSAITGHEYATCMNYSASARIEHAAIADVEYLTDIEIYGQVDTHSDIIIGEDAHIAITTIHPPVSGALILGTVAGELSAIAHLKSVQRISAITEHRPVFTHEQAIILANVYRLLEHDVTFEDMFRHSIITPYANSRDRVIVPSSVQTTPGMPSHYALLDCERRDGRTHTIPDAFNIVRTGNTDVHISRPSLRIHEWKTKVKQAKPYTSYNNIKKPAVFKIKAGYTYESATFTAKPVKQFVSEVDRPGFRMEVTEATPAKPEGSMVLGETTKTLEGVLPEASSTSLS